MSPPDHRAGHALGTIWLRWVAAGSNDYRTSAHLRPGVYPQKIRSALSPAAFLEFVCIQNSQKFMADNHRNKLTLTEPLRGAIVLRCAQHQLQSI
jgi:hypothetical protein